MDHLVIDRADFRDRVRACWLGKNIGGTLGAPHECKKKRLDLTFYDPLPSEAAANDDLDLQLVWLAAMEEAGRADLSIPELSSAWERWASAYPWNEYGFFMRNVQRGLRAPVAGGFENYFVDEMGSPIRSEIWAVVYAGDPDAAARMAWRDSMLDHAGGEGAWGEMFWAAVQAAAFLESDPRTLIRIGLNMIPPSCHLARSIREAVWCHDQGLPWDEARERITLRFAGHQPCNAVGNHGFTIVGWLYGTDFGDKLLKAVNCGWDTDCTGATLGATLGILNGTAGIPARWLQPIGERIVLHPYTRVPGAPTDIGDLTARSVALAERRPGTLVGDSATRPANLRSRLLRNGLARACQIEDIACGYERVDGRLVGLHYGGEPVLRPGEDKEIVLSLDGAPAATATLDAPAGIACMALGGGRFRLRSDGAVPGRNALTARLPGLPPVRFTILGPDEARGCGAGDMITDRCPACHGVLGRCICPPGAAAPTAGIRYLTHWRAAGPFPTAQAGRIDLDQAMPWEADLVAGAEPPANWRTLNASGGSIDLFAGLPPREWCFTYATTTLDGGSGGSATLVVGSDDAMRVWLNGTQLHTHAESKRFIDRIAVTLRPGENRLVVKLTKGVNFWWLFSAGIA